jgi:hypothetical protein
VPLDSTSMSPTLVGANAPNMYDFGVNSGAIPRSAMFAVPIDPSQSVLNKEFEAGECPGKPGP